MKTNRNLLARLAPLAAGIAMAAAAGTAQAQAQAQAQAETPKYGGSLDVATTSTGVATLSWDLADWQATLQTRDTGQFYEQL